MPRPTLRMIAKEAKVSTATVSLALRGSPEVSQKTIQRIRRLAAARGYKPDPSITKLMRHLRSAGAASGTSRANVAALVEYWKPDPTRRARYLVELLNGIRAAVEAQGYAFDIIGTNELSGRGQLDRVLMGRGVEGLFLLPLPQVADLTDRVDWARYSVVSVTSSILAPHFHQVTPNHFDNMLHACWKLKEAGYNRVGLAMSKEWDLRVNHRWAGGAAWYNVHRASEVIPTLIQDSASPEVTAAELASWLKRERPDAVIFESPDSKGLAAALARLKPRQRPLIVSMNWPTEWAACGIDQRPKAIGVAAGEALAAMVTRGERGIPESPLMTMVDGRWHGPIA